jgi:hypothetical protein
MDSPVVNTVICSNASGCPIVNGCPHGVAHKALSWIPKGGENKISCTSPGDCYCKTGKKMEVLTGIKCVKSKEVNHE